MTPKTGQPRTAPRRFGAVSVAFLLALPGQMGYTKVLPSKPAKGIHYGKKDLVSLVFRPGPGAGGLRPRRSNGSAGRRHDPPRRHDLPRLSLHRRACEGGRGHHRRPDDRPAHQLPARLHPVRQRHENLGAGRPHHPERRRLRGDDGGRLRHRLQHPPDRLRPGHRPLREQPRP